MNLRGFACAALAAAITGQVLPTLLVANDDESSTRNRAGVESSGISQEAYLEFAGKKVRQVRDDNALKMKLIWCPPGSFNMEKGERIREPIRHANFADNDDSGDAPPATEVVEKIGPVARVLLSRGYWLGRFEVTQAEWKNVMKSEPWMADERVKVGDDFPAVYISWDNAMRFGRVLTQMERSAGRLSADWEYTLPTEAQWVRACRARTETKYDFGDDDADLAKFAWFRTNAWDAGERYAHRVGLKEPNLWGFYDMHGNVWEWCRDGYQEELPGGRDPEVTIEGPERVAHGASFGERAHLSQSWYRRSARSNHRISALGFRVALAPVRLDNAANRKPN